MKVARNRWLAVVIVLTVAADWTSKLLVQRRLTAEVSLIDGLLSFRPTVNHGISWGWLKDVPDLVRFPLIVGLTAVGIGAMAGILRSSKDAWLRIAGALVLGGALGNFGDRLLNRGVTDFISIHFFPYIFNVADVAITVGGAILVARMLLERPRDTATPSHA